MVTDKQQGSLSKNCQFDVLNEVARKSRCTWHEPGQKVALTNTKHKSKPSPHDHFAPILIKSSSDIQNSILESIGCTPVVRLNKFAKKYSIKCELLVKCEFLNPGGSIKDRIALRMVQEAEREGRLMPNSGYTIIEPTSGNTGIGLAMVAAIRGYKCIIVMPEKMSSEKQSTLLALGATIIRTHTEANYDDDDSHITHSMKLQREIPKSVILNQYSAAGNALAHYDGTAEEILEACQMRLDAVVLGAGTGGTASGLGRKLREKLPTCKLIVADPAGSILADADLTIGDKLATAAAKMTVDESGFYEVEGIGYDFIPTVLDKSIVDGWVKTRDEESFGLARMLIRTEGLLVGGSSGSAMAAALRAIKHLNYQDDPTKRVLVVLPDGIRNYMTKFMDDNWLLERYPNSLFLNGAPKKATIKAEEDCAMAQSSASSSRSSSTST